MLQGLREILFKSGIDRVRIVFRFQLALVDTDEFLPLARILAKNVVTDPVEPGGKLRFAAEAPNVFVGAQKSFLREIIRERDIRAGELAKQTSDARLMPAHEFGESMVIIFENDSGDEVCISQRHVCVTAQAERYFSGLPSSR